MHTTGREKQSKARKPKEVTLFFGFYFRFSAKNAILQLSVKER